MLLDLLLLFLSFQLHLSITFKTVGSFRPAPTVGLKPPTVTITNGQIYMLPGDVDSWRFEDQQDICLLLPHIQL